MVEKNERLVELQNKPVLSDQEKDELKTILKVNKLNTIDLSDTGKIVGELLNGSFQWPALTNKPVSTGFKTLDKAINGGIRRETLGVIGAMPSLGKTTFTLQMADNLAKNGCNILFFSLEQTKEELISKSLSRIGFQRSKKIEFDEALKIRSNPSQIKYKESMLSYQKNVGNKISIVWGNHGITVEEIEEYIDAYILQKQIVPIVIIDFLQLITPTDDKANYRTSLDHILKILSAISRDKKTAVILISSFSRDNYSKPISMGSFKESGMIEYLADWVCGLQYSYIGKDFTSMAKDLNTTPGSSKITPEKLAADELEKAKNENPRKVDLVWLKQRNGIAGFTIKLNYYSKNDFFEEVNNESIIKRLDNMLGVGNYEVV